MTIAFKDTLNGLAAAPFPRRDILRTMDGGGTWTSLPPFPASVRSLEYIPGTENTYIATSFIDQYLAYTLDGGETWTFAKDVAGFSSVAFINRSCLKFWKEFEKQLQRVKFENPI